MANRYARVARTYARWPLLLAAATLLGYFAALCVAWPPTEKAQRLTYLALLTWITAWAAGTVAAQLKKQLADARSAIVPGFRGPHLIVGGIAMALVAVALPALAAWGTGFPAAGVVGIALVVAASTAWFVQLQNFTAGLVCNVLWLSLLHRPVVFALGTMLEGKNPTLAGILVACGGAALAALWVRLARMHEGMREFGRRSVAVAFVGPGMSDPVPSRGIDPWFESVLRRPVRTRCIAAADVWTRVHHLRATGLGRMPWLMGALLCGSMLALPLLSGDRHNFPAAGAMESYIIMSMILPTVITVGHWGRRWPALAYESLRPASRRRFVGEMGLVIALDLAEAWAVVTAGALIPVAIWSPQTAASFVTGGFLAVSAAATLLVFGINWWVLRLRSAVLTAIVTAVTGFAPLAPLLGRRFYEGTGWAGPLTLALLVVGALVTLDAYGRWCRADLE